MPARTSSRLLRTCSPAGPPVIVPIVARHGGAYAVRTAGHERLEGDIDAALVVVIEWPSKEAETAFFADPEYAPHRADRQAGSMTTLYSVPRQDDLA